MKSNLNPFLVSLTLVTTATGADLFWDANGAATTAVGGTGNWSSTAWRSAATTGALGTWVDGNRAAFGTTAGWVTLDQNVAVAGILFNVSGCEIRGFGTNALTFSGGSITSTSGSSHDLTVQLAGAVVFNPTQGNLTGAATFFVKANNSGLTSVELSATDVNNNMIIDDAGALGPAGSTVKLTKGILNLGALTTEAFGGTIANGSGGGHNLNAWTTELAGGTIRGRVGANTWNGPITLTANSSVVTRSALAVKMVFANTATINLNANTLTVSPTNSSDGIVLNGNISGTGGITQANSALTNAGTAAATSTTTLAGTNTYSGATQITVGRLNLTGSLTSNITLASGTQLAGEGTTTGSLTFGGTHTYAFDPTTPASHFTADTIHAEAGTVSLSLTATPTAAVSGMVVFESLNGITGPVSNFVFTGRGNLYYDDPGTPRKLLFDYTPVTLVWTGGDPTNPSYWDTSTANWKNGAVADLFQATDAVTFGDSSGSLEVAIQGTSVSPGPVTFTNDTDIYTISGGSIAGAASLVMNGDATVILATNNTYTGTTTINSGTVQLGDGIGSAGSFGTGEVINNATIAINYGSNSKELARVLGGSGKMSIQGSGVVSVTAAQAYTGDTIVEPGAVLQLGNNGAAGSLAGKVVNEGTLRFYRSDATVFANPISGAGTVAKSQGLAVTLTGDNTYTGPTAITGSAVILGSNTALGTSDGGTTISSGRLALNDGVTVTGEAVVISGSGTDFNGALQASAAATATWAGPIALDGIGARVGTGIGGTLILAGVIADGTGTSLQIGAGAGGTGTVIVSGAANTYTGVTGIVRGTLALGAANALPATTLLDVDQLNATESSVFDLAGFSQTIAGLQRSNTGGGTGAGIVTNSALTPATLTITQSVATTYSGRLTGNLSLSQSGAAALTLTGTCAHAGNTTVDGSLVLAAGGQLTLKPAANGITNAIGGTGALELNGTLALDLTTTSATHGNRWTLVNAATLTTETYGASFAVNSTLGAFSETSDVWTLMRDGNLWTFTEASGELTVGPIPDPYIAWIGSFFPEETNPAIVGKAMDPDGDGRNNLAEFALNGMPNRGADAGYRVVAIEDTNADTLKELTLTIAVRTGYSAPIFIGAPSPTATVDGIIYTVEGSLDLNFPGSEVTETAVPTGLPPLPTGWEYHRFRLAASEPLAGKGFLRVKTEAAP